MEEGKKKKKKIPKFRKIKTAKFAMAEGPQSGVLCQEKKKYFQNPQGTGPEKHRSGNGKWRAILSNSAPSKRYWD